jgi:hypothetical protein
MNEKNVSDIRKVMEQDNNKTAEPTHEESKLELPLSTGATSGSDKEQPIKVKRPRSIKQVESFRRAQKARLASIEQAKARKVLSYASL